MILSDCVGKTVSVVASTPYSRVGVNPDALERVVFTFTDGTAIVLEAGYYAIPEEPCIYVQDGTVDD